MQIFRGIQDANYDLWDSRMVALGFQHYLGSFTSHGSSLQVLKSRSSSSINERRMPFQLFLSRCLQTTRDFNHLFTNLPQPDLIVVQHYSRDARKDQTSSYVRLSLCISLFANPGKTAVRVN
jgi:hypothetical protein